MSDKHGTIEGGALVYKIPIFSGEEVVFRPSRFRDRVHVQRDGKVLNKTGYLNLSAHQRPTELHFVDQSLPSGGFRHYAVRVTPNGDSLTWERIEAPPPTATKAARRLMIGRVMTPNGTQFRFTKQ